MAEARRAPLIVFEGIDRSGKSTQVRKLAEALANDGRTVECMRFPDRTSPKTGALVDQYLKAAEEDDDGKCMQLIFAANRREKATYIEQRLCEGCTLIVDRYVDSGAAYARALGMDAQWCQGLDAGMPKPDIVIFLDVPIEDACMRAGFGGERYEQAEFLGRVRQAFMCLRGPHWQVIDANGDSTVDKVHDKVLATLHDMIV